MAKFTDNPNIKTFPEIQHFTGLTSIDMHGDSNLQAIDMTYNKQVITVNLKGTPARFTAQDTSALTKVQLGAPTSIKISGCGGVKIDNVSYGATEAVETIEEELND